MSLHCDPRVFAAYVMAEGGEQVVTPWEARAAEGAAKIDFDKLIREPTMPALESSEPEFRSIWKYENR